MERTELISLLRATGCAEECGEFVFLRDPHWSDPDRATAATAMRAAAARRAETGWLCVRTGGSGGGLKFARHDEHTLSAAVAGFCRHFELARVDTVGVLPPWHVSGLMARVRCATTGGSYVEADWKMLEAGATPELALGGSWVISLVPTQLQRLLASARTLEWLRRFRVIFLGGGPAWPELTSAAAGAGLRISLGYGMTETAAMVTGQLPEEFLAGDRSAGRALPHARVALDPEGRVVIGGESLFRGYFPDIRESREFVTEDLGRIDEAGRLHLLGRHDAMIITGGKKVHPLEVEAVLRASGEFEDVLVLGVPDLEWGEIVVACHPPQRRVPDLAKAAAALAPHQRPKRVVPISPWPRNAQGKINRAAVAAMVRQM
ncbi:MAG TPA: AMP-binding protein [Opitutaceae bacterium]|nr:AMP-binding protein [Opitutaceae bacterium]